MSQSVPMTHLFLMGQSLLNKLNSFTRHLIFHRVQAGVGVASMECDYHKTFKTC